MTAAVIDANVFVYAVAETGSDGGQVKEVLRVTDEAWVPESVRAECVNALWGHVRRNLMTIDEAVDALDEIESFLDRVAPVPPLWRRALQLSAAGNHSPYDTLFVALAEREGLRVVTFDRKLVPKFPRL